MGSYSDALRKGLAVKERRKAAEGQVNAVLTEAASDLAEIIGGGLTLHLVKGKKKVAEPQMRVGHMLGFLPRTSQEECWTIEARKAQSQPVALAEVEMAEIGYPVVLRWPTSYVSADNEEGLRSAVLELLSSRHAAEKLTPLITE